MTYDHINNEPGSELPVLAADNEENRDDDYKTTDVPTARAAFIVSAAIVAIVIVYLIISE